MGKFIRPKDLEKYDGLHNQLIQKTEVLISDLNRKVGEGEFDKQRAREIFKEQLIKFGMEFDRNLLIVHGITPENVDRKSFVLVIKAMLDKNDIPVSDKELGICTDSSDSNRRKEVETQEGEYIERDVYTDRAFNLIYGNQKNQVGGRLNYKTRWVHDVISETLWQWINKNKISKQKRPLIVIDNADDLLHIFAQLDRTKDLPVLYFTDKDFRQITGRKRLSGEEIKNLVTEYTYVTIDGEVPSYWNSEKKTYEKVKVSGPLFDVICEPSGQVTRRNNKPINEYKILMNLWGFILYNNMLQHKFTGFEKAFYLLRGSQQNLVRFLSQFKVGDYKLSTLIDIFGFKRDSIYRRKQKERIISHLNDLKTLGFIKNWSIRERKHQEPVFHIVVKQGKSRF